MLNKISKYDLRLLDALQQSHNLSQAELAEKAGMSRTSCWRRIRELEEMGVIESRPTLLNPKALGFNLFVIASIKVSAHTRDIRDQFETYIGSVPEVMECYAVSGDWDYSLQIIISDMETYNNFLYEVILSHQTVQSASSSFPLRRVKYSTALPLKSLAGA